MASFDHSLALDRAQFLSDVEAGHSGQWTVVMGNEAGDLDSLASSLGYAHRAPSPRHIALQLTPRSDLYLRPENLEALSLASISPASLVTLDDLSPSGLAHLESSFVLVDHNRLLPTFRPDDDDDRDERVVAIIDHHVDEGYHTSPSTDPRIIELVGSCSSLVTNYFLSPSSSSSSRSAASRAAEGEARVLAREVADLLISAVLIDTRLKPSTEGGKATRVDLDAVARLVPHSSFAAAEASSHRANASVIDATAQAGGGGEGGEGATEVGRESLEQMKERGAMLGKLKEDVSWMDGRDLLRRDYKEYTSEPPPTTTTTTGGGSRVVRYGLSTVPLGLEVWLDKFERGRELERVVGDVKAWMNERELDLCGVLTSYTHVKKKTGKEGKHRRELLVVARDDRLKAVVFKGLEEDPTLQLEEWKVVQDYGGVDAGEDREEHVTWKVWQQGNAKATRKQVAPVLKDLVAQSILEHE